MYGLLALNLFWLFPLAAWYLTRRKLPRRQWAAAGIMLGLIIGPASEGLYSIYFWGGIIPMPLAFICLPIGLLGLALTLFHGELPYSLAIKIGLIESHKIVEGLGHFYVTLVSGLVWGSAYGLVGWAIDFALRKRFRETKNSA